MTDPDRAPAEDPTELLHALHIPDDAGSYAVALQRLLRRIPDGRGRWIGHDAGWYPIIVACDEQLATIDPTYTVLQVKEKFGTLRYYCAPSVDLADEDRDRFFHHVRDAQSASARTCEICSKPAALREHRGWLKTLCHDCFEQRGLDLRDSGGGWPTLIATDSATTPEP